MTEEQKKELIKTLRVMDRVQAQTDEDGGREIAWYYLRDQVEDAMGLQRGALNTSLDTEPRVER